MEEIWLTRDRIGRVVSLTPAGREHIRERHEEIADRLDEVRTAIEQPDFVTRDKEYRHREIHYRRTPSGQAWMRVVVNYRPVPPQGSWAGEVITAYRVEALDNQEVHLWP